MTKTEYLSSGIGFTGLLTVMFILLKLIGEITWSWWWVLSPTLIPWGIVLFIFLIIVIIASIKELIKY